MRRKGTPRMRSATCVLESSAPLAVWIAPMQVAEEEETGERVLWATSAGVLYRYGLGQRYVG